MLYIVLEPRHQRFIKPSNMPPISFHKKYISSNIFHQIYSIKYIPSNIFHQIYSSSQAICRQYIPSNIFHQIYSIKYIHQAKQYAANIIPQEIYSIKYTMHPKFWMVYLVELRSCLSCVFL